MNNSRLNTISKHLDVLCGEPPPTYEKFCEMWQNIDPLSKSLFELSQNLQDGRETMSEYQNTCYGSVYMLPNRSTLKKFYPNYRATTKHFQPCTIRHMSKPITNLTKEDIKQC